MPLLFSVSTERRQLSLPRFFRYMTILLFSDRISFCLIGAVLEHHVRCTKILLGVMAIRKCLEIPATAHADAVVLVRFVRLLRPWGIVADDIPGESYSFDTTLL